MDEKFTQYIKDFCDDYKLIDKCKEEFWRCFESYKLEDPKAFSKTFPNENRKYVNLTLDKICLCLDYYFYYDRPTIQIYFRISLKDKEIGRYQEIYFTNGQFVDEFFVID